MSQPKHPTCLTGMRKTLLSFVVLLACGAPSATSQPLSAGESPHDAGIDAGIDAGFERPGTCHPSPTGHDRTCSRWHASGGVIEDLVCDPGFSPPIHEGPLQLQFPSTCGVIIPQVGDIEWHSDGIIGSLGSLGICTGCTPGTGAGGGPEEFRLSCSACRFTLRIIETPLDGGR